MIDRKYPDKPKRPFASDRICKLYSGQIESLSDHDNGETKMLAELVPIKEGTLVNPKENELIRATLKLTDSSSTDSTGARIFRLNVVELNALVRMLVEHGLCGDREELAALKAYKQAQDDLLEATQPTDL